MRLIDADKLILHLNDYALQESPSETESAGERRISKEIYSAIKNCITAIDEQPTAYDVDKVVERLEEIKKIMTSSVSTDCFEGECKYQDCTICVASRAIKIVKGCGFE